MPNPDTISGAGLTVSAARRREGRRATRGRRAGDRGERPPPRNPPPSVEHNSVA